MNSLNDKNTFAAADVVVVDANREKDILLKCIMIPLRMLYFHFHIKERQSKLCAARWKEKEIEIRGRESEIKYV